MHILAFSTSTSSSSINHTLVEYAAARLRTQSPAVQVELLSLIDYEMPIYSADREQQDGIPAQAHSFYEKIGAADALLVSFAEHNGAVTAAWKNTFDWMSRINGPVWQQKPVVMLAATPGGRAGANVLGNQEKLAPFQGADLKGLYGVGNWGEAWDGQTLTRDADIKGVDDAVAGLLA